MSAIEEVLWNIFTYYSLNGNPKDPSRLHSMALLKMCKDMMALDQIMTEVPITQADLHLIYTSVLKSPSKSRGAPAEKSDKLTFDEFLSCLLRIAQKCYPSMNSQEEAMQQLLMDNILPLAQRREPTSIANVMTEPAIESLLKYYEGSLNSMFKHFAAASDQLLKDRNMVKATRHAVRTFDDQVQQIQQANARCQQQSAVSKLMSYPDFLRFTSDLGLPITIVEFGDIYLTVTSFSNFSTALRRVDFCEFCEAIVRIALRAFQDLTNVSPEDKVKGLLLNMWRYSQEMLGAHMQEYGTLLGGGFNTHKEELLRSVETFTVKFKSAWAKDGYRSYLEPENESAGSSGSLGASISRSPAKRVMGGRNTSSSNLSAAGTGGGGLVTPSKTALPSGLGGPGSSTGKRGASHSKQFYTPTTSLLSKLKSPALNSHHHGGGGGGDVNDNASVMSATTGRSGTLAETIAEIQTTKEKLLSTLHEHTEESENFVVTASDGGQFRIMIGDKHKFGERGRINPIQLKRLFLHKPDIAEILYDTMVEEGIVVEEVPENSLLDDEDGLDALGISMEDIHLMTMQEGEHGGEEKGGEAFEEPAEEYVDHDMN